MVKAEADKPSDKWRPGDYVYLCAKCAKAGPGAKHSKWCEKCATEADKQEDRLKGVDR